MSESEAAESQVRVRSMLKAGGFARAFSDPEIFSGFVRDVLGLDFYADEVEVQGGEGGEADDEVEHRWNVRILEMIALLNEAKRRLVVLIADEKSLQKMAEAEAAFAVEWDRRVAEARAAGDPPMVREAQRRQEEHAEKARRLYEQGRAQSASVERLKDELRAMNERIEKARFDKLAELAGLRESKATQQAERLAAGFKRVEAMLDGAGEPGPDGEEADGWQRWSRPEVALVARGGASVVRIDLLDRCDALAVGPLLHRFLAERAGDPGELLHRIVVVARDEAASLPAKAMLALGGPGLSDPALGGEHPRLVLLCPMSAAFESDMALAVGGWLRLLRMSAQGSVDPASHGESVLPAVIERIRLDAPRPPEAPPQAPGEPRDVRLLRGLIRGARRRLFGG